jgi:type I restriction enzyme R subunit
MPLRELHRIVNDAVRIQAPGNDQDEGLTFDLSQIDLQKLRDEFAKKVSRKATALQDIRDIIERKLAEMLARNPSRMDYQRKYEEIIADYNREKDITTIEETFSCSNWSTASTRNRSGRPRRGFARTNSRCSTFS